jgi:hypothetical protein
VCVCVCVGGWVGVCVLCVLCYGMHTPFCTEIHSNFTLSEVCYPQWVEC